MKKAETKIVKIDQVQLNTGQIKGLSKNPRFIKNEKFDKLVNSIKEFPEMLNLRPIVVDENMVVLGGNMRLKACQEVGLKEIPINIAKGLTIQQKNEFLIKDNVGFGDWEWEILANEWKADKLAEWGLETFDVSDIDLEEFFEEDNTAPKEETNKIVLEYSEKDYQIINDKFNSMDGSKENIVWKLLAL